MQNRREHPRYEISLSVEVFSEGDALPAVARNLSLGGVGIALAQPLAKGAQVGLSMFLLEDGIEDERSAPINLRADVCWCAAEAPRGYTVGLRFLEPTPAEVERIQSFLRRLQEQS